MDVFDPSYTPGVGNPDPLGFTTESPAFQGGEEVRGLSPHPHSEERGFQL